MLRHLLPVLILVVSAVTCVRIGQARGPIERAHWNKLAPPPMSSWSDRAINAAMLGHRGLYDDVTAIWLVQALVDQKLTTYATADQTYELITSVTRHHPKLESIYALSCFVMALDYNRPELCEGISQDGLRAFPSSWRILMTQGFVAAFKMNDPVKASGYYALASSRPEAPPWVQNVAQKLAARGDHSGKDLNDTIEFLKDLPGGAKVLELLRPTMQTPPANPTPPAEPSIQQEGP